MCESFPHLIAGLIGRVSSRRLVVGWSILVVMDLTITEKNIEFLPRVHLRSLGKAWWQTYSIRKIEQPLESCHWRKQTNSTLRPRPARRKRQSKTMIRWTLLRIAELSVVLSLLKFATSLFHLFLKSHVLPFRGIRTQKPERPCMRMKILAGCNGSYYHICLGHSECCSMDDKWCSTKYTWCI